MRPDAHRFFCPDWRRYMRAGQENDLLYKHFERFERKYSPDQPRVPQGSPNGGQWTNNGDPGASGRNDPRIISDAAPDSVSPSIQYAQNRPRGGFASVIINGQQVEPTPGQQARLAVVEAQARDAIQHVRELDPKWQSTPSAYESVEGLIGAYRSDAQQALERFQTSASWHWPGSVRGRVNSRAEAQSGISLLQSAVRSIGFAPRPDAIRAVP